MGTPVSKPLKPPTRSVIVANAKSPAVIHSNDDKIAQTEKLIENIHAVLKQMKTAVEGNWLVPNRFYRKLFMDLESLSDILNPKRMHVCYVVGSTNAGKSSLINSISNTNKCKVSHLLDAGSTTFEIIPVPEMNTMFMDTIGFGSSLNDSDLVRRFQKQHNVQGLPDSILLVVTQDHLRNRASLKNTIDYINKVIKRVKNVRHNTLVPIICVLNKIDLCFPDGLSDSVECREKMAELMEHTVEIVREFLEADVTLCAATSTTKNYGMEELRCSINAESPLYAQMIDNNLDYMSKQRWIIANKIIAGFTMASAAVSFLPIADIVFVTILQEWMYRMLACFSIDPARTPDTFKTVHRAVQGANLGLRAAALFVGGIFQLSVIGYLIGSSICVGTATVSTAALAWASYYYFIGEASPEKHDEQK